MTGNLPLVSIVMATYNRAGTIERAVNSVLSQNYPNLELIIVDDGSKDNTLEILSQYTNPAIRIFKLETNKGVTAAKNAGLNQIRGEWFTILDSDDEMLPEAIMTMIRIPLELDPEITAVTCNCLDTTTRRFSGIGPGKDGYVTVDELMTFRGEFWGITKTQLLGNDRFNEKLRGFESTLWYKIDDRANRYYCHQALRVYHTEGQDRIMKRKYDFEKDVVLYENLITEMEFLYKQKKYDPVDFNYLCRSGLMIMQLAGKKQIAGAYFGLLKGVNQGWRTRMMMASRTAAALELWLVNLKKKIKKQ
ncbi:MAG TPA: glycosyltransferase family 2 protein [Chitinophagaceae bacterium]|nr:glycosyltransferase family 2 protein [Chitinophagaceae bacterium]HPH30268.1 glycosyltransferase family 2 protein [Chitinophagaceae bacterium]HPN57754.1 glycosyltransferase family 2 protein [Chitinophagaceae bacterium]